ncbi:MAG TPA: hypothetical protein VLG50_00245 [Candidatus Saccharimonadales bacterium]|nr:hypothetical protein [Candidatus Saccharimonadales bacterium]
MKMKIVIFAVCVFGAFEINTMFKATVPCAFKKITNMAGVAELVKTYGYTVHKYSNEEFVADKKISQMDYAEVIITNIKNSPENNEEISIRVDVLPTKEYMIRAKHETSKRVFNEKVINVFHRTAIVSELDRVANIIENFLNNG